MTKVLSESYVFIVDTNTPTSGFARELTAYCTGLVGDCETGRQYSDVFYMEMGLADDDERLADEKNPFSDRVVSRMDENGNWLPCGVYVNPDFGMNDEGVLALLTKENYKQFSLPAYSSVGIYFDREPTTVLVNLIRERAKKFVREVWPATGGKEANIQGYRVLREIRTVELLETHPA